MLNPPWKLLDSPLLYRQTWIKHSSQEDSSLISLAVAESSQLRFLFAKVEKTFLLRIFFFLFRTANSHILNNHPESWLIWCDWLARRTCWARGAGVRILPAGEDTQTSAAWSQVPPSDFKLLSAVQQLDATFRRHIPGGGPHFLL